MKPTEKDLKRDILAYAEEKDEEIVALRAALKAEKEKDSDLPIEGTKDEQEYVEKEYIEIRPDKYIQVISLCPNPLTLRTTITGTGGKSFKFKSLGQTKRILYQDLVDVMEVQPTFLEAGVFYIANKDVIRRHGLDEFYENIITKEQMEEVLEAANADTAFSIFKSANKRQQKYLADMFVKRIAGGEEIDRNFIHLASQETGINIESEAEEERKFKNILDGKEEK